MKELERELGRFEQLRKLLEQGQASTQEELCEELSAKGFSVTQSTISRWLRRLGAQRVIDESGRAVYRLPLDAPLPPRAQASYSELVTDIVSNSSLIVLKTVPGSASLVARHLDHHKPGGILGTLAGDDTIFVAPPATSPITVVVAALRESLQGTK